MSGRQPPAGARRAPRSVRSPSKVRRLGRSDGRAVRGKRALRPRQRRTRGLGGTLGLTFVGALVPGTGYLFAGRKAAGWIVLVGWAVVVGAVAWLATRDREELLVLVLDPERLQVAALVIAGLLALWVAVVWTSYRLIRPRERPTSHTVIGNIAVVLACVIVALPAVQAARYTLATADFMADLFGDNQTATTPDDWTKDNPFGSRERINVLLLGGDSNEHRDGVRTDSIMLLSVDTRTGETVSFGLPRNMEHARFPVGSPLAELYPYGFAGGTAGDANYMLNAVYQNVPRLHPGVLGASTDEGADAVKQAVSGSLGIPVEYYVMVDLAGFRTLVDAMGGVTVNINEPVAIGGNTDRGIPPDDWLETGPSQHLDGFEALWFARGRWGSDDYARMERQRCVVDAIIQEADPGNLLVRYLDLLDAGREIVRTDIPEDLASAFVSLALRAKESHVQSVVFQRSSGFDSGDPDFDRMQQRVARALGEEAPASTPTDDPAAPSAEPSTAPSTDSATPALPDDGADELDLQAPVDAADACAYHPTAAAAPES